MMRLMYQTASFIVTILNTSQELGQNLTYVPLNPSATFDITIVHRWTWTPTEKIHPRPSGLSSESLLQETWTSAAWLIRHRLPYCSRWPAGRCVSGFNSMSQNVITKQNSLHLHVSVCKRQPSTTTYSLLLWMCAWCYFARWLLNSSKKENIRVKRYHIFYRYTDSTDIWK